MPVASALTAAMAAEKLYASSCARVTLSEDRLLHIAAQDGAVCISDEDVAAVLASTEALMVEGVEFRTLWDLRACPVPTIAVVGRCVRWALKNKSELDRLNKQMGVVVPTTGKAVAALVATVLTTFGPTCEVRVSSSQAEVAQFMARQKSWPSA